MSNQFFEIIPLVCGVMIGICFIAVLYAIAAVLTPMRLGHWRHGRQFDVSLTGKFLSVSVLKPLCGDEPRLYENLATFCDQTHPAFQLICGVASSNDPAIKVVRRLQGSFPDVDIVLVVDKRLHGENRKVSNLINMAAYIRYPWIVIADSDIAVARDYLQRVTTPLLDPRVGVVTCLYRGVSVSGVWSRMGALFINQWFAPSVSLAYAGGSTRFGFGATLALRATTLACIGGFMRLKDCLADDYWLAEHARLLGLKTVLSTEVVATDVVETNPKTLWSRELRWLRTIRSLNPLGFGFLFITFTSPWLLIAGALLYGFYIDAAIDMPVDAVGGAATDLATDWATDAGNQVANEMTTLASIDMACMVAGIAVLGCVARLLLHGRSAYHTGGFWRDLLLLPVRDSVLLLQWIAACFGNRVAWRGASIAIDASRSHSNTVFCVESQSASNLKSNSKSKFQPDSTVTPKRSAMDKPALHPSSLAGERSCTVSPLKQHD